ncbi:MAG: methyl-accepting chemotaxis protein [Pontixanthobacter sp.]
MNAMSHEFVARRAPDKIGSQPWERHLALFDPDNILDSLTHGMHELLKDHYFDFYLAQVATCRLDPILNNVMTDEAVERDREMAIAHSEARFVTPWSNAWGDYVTHFAQMLVRIGASTHIAVAVISTVYDEAMKIAIDKLEGDDLARIARGLRMMTSIETDMMVAAMHDALREKYTRTIQQQADVFERNVLGSVGKLNDVAQTLRSSAVVAADSSSALHQASSAVASATKQSTEAMEQANKSVGYLSSTVEAVRATAKQTSSATARVSGKATDTADMVGQLATNGKQIDAIVALIRNIAEQTQILSLNAAIEAANAGEAGIGFAVVADEVKNLAAGTFTATEEIADQVGEIKQATEHSVAAAQNISEDVLSINEGAEAVEREVESQFNLIETIVDAISETFMSAEHVSENVTEINELAGKVADRFADVDTQFRSVDGLLSTLQDDMRAYRKSFDKLIADPG